MKHKVTEPVENLLNLVDLEIKRLNRIASDVQRRLKVLESQKFALRACMTVIGPLDLVEDANGMVRASGETVWTDY
jgi:hypothetical protein